MKKILVTILLAAMLPAMFDGCKSSVTAPPDAKFYLINASPDSQGLDFFLDGSGVVNNLIYSQDTGYFSTSPGIHDLVFKKAGTSKDLVNINMSLTAGQPYSIFVIDSVNKLRPAAIADSTVVPVGDTVKVRLLNFCIHSPSLIAEFFVDTSVVLRYFSRTFNDQNSNPSQTLFSKIIARSYTLNLKRSKDSFLITSFKNIQLSAGKIYTIYLKGSYDSTNSNSIGEGIVQHN
ncbi:MAG TPA: DUF4397 domain-containing protein [Chitinophagaceae bacterium]|jgi:hypothetical protein